MATILDVGLLQYFSVIFPMLLVFALVLAILQKTKALGENTPINALVAAVAAFLLLLSPSAVALLNFIIPWFAVAIIFFVLLILIFQMFGMKESDWGKVVKDKAFYWTILGVGLVIMVAGFGDVFGQTALEYSQNASSVSEGGGDFRENAFSVLFHPKVLGMLVLFTIAIMAIALLTS